MSWLLHHHHWRPCIKLVLVLLLLSSAAGQCPAQVPHTMCPDATAAAQLLTGNSAYLPITNAVFTGTCAGSADGTGQFATISSFTPGCHYLSSLMPQGALVISTGSARIGARTNNTENASTSHKTTFSDKDVQDVNSKIYSQPLNDLAMLTFDIVPTASGAIYFSYCFGSEEYPEYAPGGVSYKKSTTNDVFAFFCWAGAQPRDSIALLPGTSTYVSILSVNAEAANSLYYRSNVGNTLKTELDGVTAMLNTTTVNVVAGTLYSFKLAIADGGAGDYDSVVWIKGGSLAFTTPPQPASPSPQPSPSPAAASPLPQVSPSPAAASPSPSPVVPSPSASAPEASPSPLPDPPVSPEPVSNSTNTTTPDSSPAPEVNATQASPEPAGTNTTSADSSPAPEVNTTHASPEPAGTNTTSADFSPAPEVNATQASPSPTSTNTTSADSSPAPEVNATQASPEPAGNATEASPTPGPAAGNTTDSSPSPGPAAGNTTDSSPSPVPAAGNTTDSSPSPVPATGNTSSPGPSPQSNATDASPTPQPGATSPTPSPSAAAQVVSSPSPSPAVPAPLSPSPSLIVSSPTPEPNFDDFVWGPPLDWRLPPMNDTGIVLRGGNVTISGLSVEADSSAGTDGSAAGAVLKQRTAAFNGSLGFISLGLSIEVMGQFALKRSMSWIYNSRMECWVAEVLVSGVFRLTREDVVNNVSVANSTLEPFGSGTLNMFSVVFPGPGFTGTYDWAGALGLQPDPFLEWGFSTLQSPQDARRHRLLLGQGAAAAAFLDELLPHTRSLLQAGDGSLSVHGRVSVREARDPLATGAAGSSSGALQPGSEAAIDSEIMAYYPVPPDPSNPAGYVWLEEGQEEQPPPPPAEEPPLGAELPAGVQDAFAAIVRALQDPTNQKTMIIVAALVAPLGVALCVVGAAAAFVRRRKQRHDKEQRQAGSESGCKTERPAQHVAAAEQDASGGDAGTVLHFMQPHETGYGSVCGAGGQAVLPPSRDSSADGGRVVAAQPQGVFNHLRSSLTGMAAAIGLHRDRSGAYQVPPPPQQLRAPVAGGGLLRGPSLELHWPAALRRREPTLPGASRKSVDEPRRPGGAPGGGGAAAPAAVSTALPVQQQQQQQQPAAGAAAAYPKVARLGVFPAAQQPAGSRHHQQQRQAGVAAQWLHAEQAAAGPSSMWSTPPAEGQHARGGSSIYNNPLALEGSDSGAGGGQPGNSSTGGDSGGFFLEGGDTFLLPVEPELQPPLMLLDEQQPPQRSAVAGVVRSRPSPRSAPFTQH